MTDQILTILLQKGILTEQNAKIVQDLVARGKTIDQALVGGRYVLDKDYAQALAQVLNLEYLDLENWEMPEGLLKILPEETVKSYRILPLGLKEDGTFVYSMMDPHNIRGEEAMQFFASGKGWKLKKVIVPTTQIQKYLKIGGIGTDISDFVEQVKSRQRQEQVDDERESKDLKEVIKGAPVARMLTTIMRNAVEQRASDIHIEPLGDQSRVRYRVDGVLRTILTLPGSIHPSLVARVKVLSNLKLDETRIPQDGRIRQSYGDKTIDFRISTLPVVDNEKVVLRVLDTSTGAPTLQALGYRKEHVDVILEEIRKTHGLFLVTGPTGSGKSTTLFSCLNLLNNEGVNISTLEDPVEYYIAGVNQSQIRPAVGYTFASGLRSILRQDPNVIMVGEIRDLETAELAIHASLTGHLMFSTLHTNDASGIVPRLIDMGAQPFLLAATLNIGIAQRLARKICDHCRQEQEVDPVVFAQIKTELQDIPEKYFHDGIQKDKVSFFRGKGCSHCKETGYQGRVAIVELFLFTANARMLVEKGFPAQDAQEEARRQGMITLRQDAILKALAGLTTIEEVFRLSQEAEEGESADSKP